MSFSYLLKDVDEGWWEGKKSDGIVGLFPLAYVQVGVVVIYNFKTMQDMNTKS